MFYKEPLVEISAYPEQFHRLAFISEAVYHVLLCVCFTVRSALHLIYSCIHCIIAMCIAYLRH